MDTLRYLALGDSYTIGELVELGERWPVQLVSRLREAGASIADPEIIAVTGWTTDELMAGIEEASPQGPYDLVSLLIGVNNQYRGCDEEEYRQEFITLLEQAIGFAEGDRSNVVVVSIPDWSVTPFAKDRDQNQISTEIDTFNAINREESEQRGVAYVDITPVSREDAHDPQLTTSDGLHPSGMMYAKWTDLIAPVVRDLLV